MFSRTITTLNFEGNTVRILTGKGDQVLSWDSLSFPDKHMTQGLIHKPDAVSERLKQWLDEHEGGRRVYTSVTDQRSVHRMLTLPAIDEKLLDETIQRKAKQEFALPIEDVDLSWEIVDHSSNQYRIYVLAVPKQIIDRQMETIQLANLKIQAMRSKSLALIKAANHPQALIINLEPYSMAVIIVVDGIPVIVRTVPLESGDLPREAKLDLLQQELTRTTKFYNESNKQNRLPEDTPLFPTGSLFEPLPVEERLMDRPSLTDRLKARTPYPVRGYQPALAIPPKMRLMQFAVNMGLFPTDNQ